MKNQNKKKTKQNLKRIVHVGGGLRRCISWCITLPKVFTWRPHTQIAMPLCVVALNIFQSQHIIINACRMSSRWRTSWWTHQLTKMTRVRTNSTREVKRCQSWPVAVSSHSSESSCFSVIFTLFLMAILRIMTLASSRLPRLINHRGDSGNNLFRS